MVWRREQKLLSRIFIVTTLSKVLPSLPLRAMREISPASDVSVDDYIKLLPSELRSLVAEIRRQKRAGARSRPSATLIDHSTLMTKPMREKLIDAIAELVDENYAGRSEMCLQFAALLHRSLNHLKFPARPVIGWAIYFGTNGRELFRWRHAWVRVGDEVIDGNVDCLAENRVVPKTVLVAPYWGPISQVPSDRRLREEFGTALPADVDVDDIWWPELQRFLERGMSA